MESQGLIQISPEVKNGFKTKKAKRCWKILQKIRNSQIVVSSFTISQNVQQLYGAEIFFIHIWVYRDVWIVYKNVNKTEFFILLKKNIYVR